MELEEPTKNVLPIGSEATVFCESMGDLILGGVLFYGLECLFLRLNSQMNLVKFSSSGVGDVVDVADSELEGKFFGDPQMYVGKCYYSLEEAEDGGGGMVLTLRKTKGGEPIGRFLGGAEGFGEAVIIDKKGHLHLDPSIHKNEVSFVGDSSIKKIDFELDSECITEGQPYHGVHRDWESRSKMNQLKIDVKCGRKSSRPPASYFNDAAEGMYRVITRLENKLPSELHFAIKGVLTIDGQGFNICLGQAGAGFYNPWYLASNRLVAVVKHKGVDHYYKGHLGRYTIDCESSDHAFKVKRTT